MKTINDLDIYQLSNELVGDIYKLTKNYPKNETFGLISQMQRCVVSLPTNIAEGYNRGSTKEFVRFLYITNGSASELNCLLDISKDLKYLNIKQYFCCISKLIRIKRMNSKLIKSLKKKINS